MSFSVRAITRRVLVITSASVLALSALPAAAADSLEELLELNLRAWSGEPELLAEVYAPDAVHTALFYDTATEYVGPQEIAQVVGLGALVAVAPRVDIPAPEGEYRWADFISLGGGSTCLWRAVDGLVVRQDCLVPKSFAGNTPGARLSDDSTSAAIDELLMRTRPAWGAGSSVEALAAAYAPDAVHSARFTDEVRTYVGPDEITKVAGADVPMQDIGPRIEFPAPEGELAWAQVSDLAGGSVCLFHARDGMVTHHDCIVPVEAP